MFLNPLLLSLLVLGAVPIIIHLLNRRRFRPVIWAAMEFLLQAIEKNARRLQLRDIILMLIRTAAVLCLTLALARPAVTGRGFLGSGMKTGAIILLDNSLSMGYNNGRETRFEVGKRLARSVLAQLEPGSWCGLFTFNDDVRLPLGEPSPDLAYLEQELERSVHLSDGGTNIEKALRHAKGIFEKHREYILSNREMYVITDMQSRPWNPKEVSGEFHNLVRELGTSAAVYLINAGDAGGSNAAIVELAPTDTLAAVDTPIAFVAKVKNFGKTVDGLALDVFVDPKGKDDKPTERLTLNAPEGEVVSATFEAKFATGGDHKVEVRLADDSLMGDNRRYCTIEVVDESRILLVDGHAQRADDPLANETGYLRFALSPRDPENPERQTAVVTETVSQGRFADRNLLNYQAVVLANVSRLPQTAVTTLERQVRSGLGLLIFLGDQVEPSVLNGMLGEAGAKLLPAKIGSTWGEAVELGTEKMPPAYSFATAMEKLSHPIMSEFNNADYGAEFLSAVKIYKAFELEKLADDSTRPVAWLTNGKPAIVEKKVGSGVVLLFAFPATTAWGNLPTQQAFPILMLRAASLLTLGNRSPKNLSVNAPIHGVMSLADQTTTVRITPPPPAPKKETRPELTTDGRAAFDYADTDRAGFYDVVLDRTPKVSMTYALNPNTEVESNLDVVLPASLQQFYPGFTFSFIANSEGFANKLAGERRGTELWPWFLGMVFVLLAVESILCHRWAPRD
ncbi:MAG: BatA domain-containing protein [Planctomycetota bacterium]|nr:BatA domain-containing protein [Planctomycetota bacterium]